MKKNACFAEIIESCLDHFTAQCWQWDNLPSFGTLVQVEDNDQVVLGIVTSIKTGSIDPARSPFPYQKTEEELMAQQPHIFEFLKSTFTVQIVGYKKDYIAYLLPPKPSKIHAFVSPCDPTTSRLFFQKHDFLHLLFAFSHNIENLDELLLAIISQQKTLFSANSLDDFCKNFTLLTGSDYRRLKLFLKRAQSIL